MTNLGDTNASSRDISIRDGQFMPDYHKNNNVVIQSTARRHKILHERRINLERNDLLSCAWTIKYAKRYLLHLTYAMKLHSTLKL